MVGFIRPSSNTPRKKWPWSQSIKVTTLLVLALTIITVRVFLSRTKFASLSITVFDDGIRSMPIYHQYDNDYSNSNSSSSSSNSSSSNRRCFQYTDNLYHYMSAALTGYPMRFQNFNRIPKLQKDVIGLLDVHRCDPSKAKDEEKWGGVGTKDLERYIDLVRSNLLKLHEKCTSYISTTSDASSSKSSEEDQDVNKKIDGDSTTKKKKSCLHLDRDMNRRVVGCDIPERLCDKLVFDENSDFCDVWNTFQHYKTIISPHGFQLTIPILALAVADFKSSQPSSSSKSRSSSNVDGNVTTSDDMILTTDKQKDITIVEIRWRGYSEHTYERMADIFGMNHTLIFGYSPGGKLNNEDSMECNSVPSCRKSERKRDLHCDDESQQQLLDTLLQHSG